MTTTPLPRTSAQIRLAHANDSITKLEQASADLEAEVQRFRDHLTKQNAELDELIPMAQKLEAENQRLREALTHAVEIAEGKRPGTWDDLLQYRAALKGSNHD